MPAVLVHGVPETSAVWDPLRAILTHTETEALSLPGFGCPRPEGFGATKDEYVEWLVDELEARQSGGPVDLVGHDWGGGLVVRLVSIRPDLVRSWVSDAAGIAGGDFEWHDFAKIWQTPGEGEAFFVEQLSQPLDQRAEVFSTMFAVPPDRAGALAGWVDPTMAGCILALYRSAVDVGREWSPRFVDVPAPGLVVLPSEDPFLSAEGARAAGRRAGAGVAELAGLGHWWMLQDPAAGARMLEGFWAGLGDP